RPPGARPRRRRRRPRRPAGRALPRTGARPVGLPRRQDAVHRRLHHARPVRAVAAGSHPMTWELAEHTADVAVRVRGRDLAEVLRGPAEATASLLADLAAVQPVHAVPLALAAPDREALAVALANEIIFQHDTTGLVLPRLDVDRLDDTALAGTLRGD